MLRRYHDATVDRVPTAAEIAAVEKSVPDSRVVVLVEAGQPLSALRDQDSYSFEIANIFLGARSQEELLARYRDVARCLPFEFSDGRPVEAWQFTEVRY
jgi:hypothetical protein